jgi:hypothetical protein
MTLKKLYKFLSSLATASTMFISILLFYKLFVAEDLIRLHVQDYLADIAKAYGCKEPTPHSPVDYECNGYSIRLLELKNDLFLLLAYRAYWLFEPGFSVLLAAGCLFIICLVTLLGVLCLFLRSISRKQMIFNLVIHSILSYITYLQVIQWIQLTFPKT